MERHPPRYNKKKDFDQSTIPKDTPTGWFDGDAQQSGAMSSAGGVIKINTNSSIRWTLCCSPGTNTKAELLGAWATLHLASRHNVENLHLVGDSKVIIDWLKNQGKLHPITLLAWKDRVKSLFQHFKKLTFSHSSREFNKEADLLSKSALKKRAGVLSFNHWLDGHEGPTLAIKIF
jgi:ribonuclease HI